MLKAQLSPSIKFKTPAIEELASKVEFKLKARFGSDIITSEILYDFPTYTLKREVLAEVLAFLYNDSELEFRFLTSLCALHFPDNEGQEFGMVYQLHNLPENWRIRLKTFMPKEDPSVPTATNLYRAANWMERQEYDFFGVQFIGHPNLKRILNMDEMTYFPLRKEYPLEDLQREDKNDAFFGR
jgi:NADH-quinone oxidoreductase subunit C